MPRASRDRARRLPAPVTAKARVQGSVFAAYDASAHVVVFDIANGRPLARWRVDGLHALALSKPGTVAVSVGPDITLRAPDGTTRQLERVHTGTVATLEFDAEGARLLSAGSDGVIHVWDVARGKLQTTLTGHTGFVSAARFHPIGFVLSLSNDNTMKMWEPARGDLLIDEIAHRGGALRLEVTATQVITTGQDGTILVREVPR